MLARAVADSSTPDVERVVTETVTTAKVLKGEGEAEALGEAYAESSDQVSAGAAGIANAVCRDGEDKVVTDDESDDESDDDAGDSKGDGAGDVVNGDAGADRDDEETTDNYNYVLEPAETKKAAIKPKTKPAATSNDPKPDKVTKHADKVGA